MGELIKKSLSYDFSNMSKLTLSKDFTRTKHPGGTQIFFGGYLLHGFPKVGSREWVFLGK